MRVKRYVSPTLQEAMERIRVDLGKDAVILNTKRIRSGGFLGLFKKEEFEVLAAIEQDKVMEMPLKKERALINDAPLKHGSNAFKQTDQQEQSYAINENDRTSSNEEVLKEVKEMREIMAQLVKQKDAEMLTLPVFQPFVERLRDQEVEEEVILYLIREVMSKHEGEHLNEEKAAALIATEMTVLLSKRLSRPNSDTRLFHLVGPTGVGKTTTIAKLAANYLLKQRKKVGFITTDTYRIAAIEQLRTYANILNAPLEVVYKATEMQQALQQLHKNDLILMDTAGRNYRDHTYVEELSHFLNTLVPSETILVLSLTARYNDNLAIIRQFSGLKVDNIIYTKMDETETYGSILNIAFHHPLQLMFLTNGQTVPDDLIVADPERLTNLILGGVNHDK